MSKLKKKIRNSVFDRLIDNGPQQKDEATPSAETNLRQLRASVRRDLENFLNTRLRIVSVDENFEETQHSLLNYGLPDLATINIVDVEKKSQFTQDLTEAIRNFEPRFKNVNVSFIDNTDATDRTTRFRIDATLYADPAPETVIFDSTLEPVSRSVNVEESHHV